MRVRRRASPRSRPGTGRSARRGLATAPGAAGATGWLGAAARSLPKEQAEPDHVDAIGQWSDAEHLDAIERRNRREHWILERDGRPAGYLIAYDCRATGAGVYVKRILVDVKGRGTGRAGLAAYLDDAFARPGVDSVWLIVRNGNDRARAVYEALGFERFVP